MIFSTQGSFWRGAHACGYGGLGGEGLELVSMVGTSKKCLVFVQRFTSLNFTRHSIILLECYIFISFALKPINLRGPN